MEGNAHGRTMYDDVSTVPAGQQWHTACCRSCCCIPRIAAAMLCAEETMRTKADQNMMERARARHASWMQRNKLPFGSKKQSWAKLDFYIISKLNFRSLFLTRRGLTAKHRVRELLSNSNRLAAWQSQSRRDIRMGANLGIVAACQAAVSRSPSNLVHSVVGYGVFVVSFSSSLSCRKSRCNNFVFVIVPTMHVLPTHPADFSCLSRHLRECVLFHQVAGCQHASVEAVRMVRGHNVHSVHMHIFQSRVVDYCHPIHFVDPWISRVSPTFEFDSA